MSSSQNDLKSPFKVQPISGAWYPLAFRHEVGDKPFGAELFGSKIALFATASGTIGALQDRCPHRNVPLSLGRVQGDVLQCAYHGWTFDGQGQCKHVPALDQQSAHRGRRAHAYDCLVQDGLIWVRIPSDYDHKPNQLQCVSDKRYTIFRERIEMNAPLDAVAENALDVPHTAFLHTGLFRGTTERNPVQVNISRSSDRVQAEFVGEKTPSGLLARFLGTKGGVLQHHDRFIAPCLAQVEYRLADKTHVLAHVALCPTSSKTTTMFATVAIRVDRLPAPIARLAKPLAMKIIHQDARILDAQTRNIHRFGEESFASTELDVLGPAIRALLSSLAQGKEPPRRPDKQIQIWI